VAIPVHAQSPEDDSERTDLIPRIDEFTEPQAWRPDAPDRSNGHHTNGAMPGDVLPERERPERPDGDPKSKRGKHRRPLKKKPLWQELLTLFAVALLLTFVIQHFIGRVYSIPSGSMEKTLHGCPGCTGDRVLVDKLTYAFTDPSPGDVVVFKGPNTWTENDIQAPPSGNVVTDTLQSIGAVVGLAPPDERDFVKRVIAVGGQTVQCCDNRMRVLVDGRPVLYVERGGRSLLSFTEDDPPLRAAAEALSRAVREGWLGQLAVQRADGEIALTSNLADILRDAGFRATPKGLRLRA